LGGGCGVGGGGGGGGWGGGGVGGGGVGGWVSPPRKKSNYELNQVIRLMFVFVFSFP
jgi:hypothetical protein